MEGSKIIRELLASAPMDAMDDVLDGIETAIEEHGWPVIRDGLMAVLEEPTRPLAHWELAACAFWGAVLDRRPMHADRVIALVYARLPDEDGAENNLAWSIASKLRGVDYLSDYNPLADPSVLRELRSIRGSGPPSS
jgi:hypothetical protein